VTRCCREGRLGYGFLGGSRVAGPRPRCPQRQSLVRSPLLIDSVRHCRVARSALVVGFACAGRVSRHRLRSRHRIAAGIADAAQCTSTVPVGAARRRGPVHVAGSALGCSGKARRHRLATRHLARYSASLRCLQRRGTRTLSACPVFDDGQSIECLQRCHRTGARCSTFRVAATRRRNSRCWQLCFGLWPQRYTRLG
jgi:hypothetical protein